MIQPRYARPQKATRERERENARAKINKIPSLRRGRERIHRREQAPPATIIAYIDRRLSLQHILQLGWTVGRSTALDLHVCVWAQSFGVMLEAVIWGEGIYIYIWLRVI